MPFNVDKDITAHLWGKLIHARDYGIYRVMLDGKELAVVDLYSEETKRQADHWGAHKLDAGPHVLRFECKGKSDKSTGYFLGLDSIAAVVPVYERPPGFDSEEDTEVTGAGNPWPAAKSLPGRPVGRSNRLPPTV